MSGNMSLRYGTRVKSPCAIARYLSPENPMSNCYAHWLVARVIYPPVVLRYRSLIRSYSEEISIHNLYAHLIAE